MAAPVTHSPIPHQPITVFSATQQSSRVESARIELAARQCIGLCVDTIETPHQRTYHARRSPWKDTARFIRF